jgi:hypothetical protein
MDFFVTYGSLSAFGAKRTIAASSVRHLDPVTGCIKVFPVIGLIFPVLAKKFPVPFCRELSPKRLIFGAYLQADWVKTCPNAENSLLIP